MKALEKFIERVKRVWAGFIATHFSGYAIEKKTLSTNPEAISYLPGSEKEIAYLEKMSVIGSDFLKSRKWSQATRVWLLKKQRFDLIPQIETFEEADLVAKAVVFDGFNTSIRHFAEAVKVYTFNASYLKEWLDMAYTKSGKAMPDYLWEVLSIAPHAFDGLEAYAFLGLKSQKAILRDEDRWATVRVIVKYRPELAADFLQLLQNIPPHRPKVEGKPYSPLGEKLDALFIELWGIVSSRAKSCGDKKTSKDARTVVDFLPYISVFFPELYKKFLHTVYSYPREMVGTAVRLMLPQVLQMDSEKDDIGEAGIWAQLAVQHASDVPDLLYRYHEHFGTHQLLSDVMLKMCRQEILKYFFNLEKLQDFAETYNEVELYREEVVDRGSTILLMKQFPFSGWNENLRKKALLKVKNELSYEQLNSLEEENRCFVQDNLRVDAEISFIQECKSSDMFNDGIAKYGPFMDGSLIYILQLDPSWIRLLFLLYIKKYSVSNQVWMEMLDTPWLSDDDIVSYVAQHSLDEEGKFILLQSKRKRLACRV